MKKKKNNGIFYVAISLVVVLAIGCIAWAYSGGNPRMVVEGNYEINVSGNYIESERPTPDMEFGALPSNEILHEWLSVNSVKRHYMNMKMRTATTTVCAFRTPAATTTLDYFSVNYDSATTSAMTITIAKAANAYATTTLIDSWLKPANTAQLSFIASSTADAAGQAGVIKPSQYLVVGQAAGGTIGASVFSPKGRCKAILTDVESK